MQKMTKEAILDLPLESFGIRLLSLWINRPEKWSARRLGSESEETKSKPKTVRELIRRYPYRFSSRHGSSYQTGLGSEPISELKKKLIELGLTPDDWPALVPNHKNLVDYLSMESIEALPLLEVFTLKNHHGSLYGLSRYLNCKEEEVRSITIRDFLKVNPYHLSDEVNGISGVDFFKDHKRFLFVLNQKLRERGFTRKDGAFFMWNPVAHAHKKACAILAKHKLSKQQVRRFAEIVVAERWVI